MKTNILNEEVNSGSAIVYHRDVKQKSFEDLLNGKFKAGNGDYYGKGFYSFLDKTSLRGNTSYGPVIYKLKIINLHNFFFFDLDEYNKIFHSKINSTEELVKHQVKKFGIKATGTTTQEDIFDAIEDYSGRREREPRLAKWLTDIKHTNLQNRCNGIIYTGGYNDGNVCVVYPHAYDNIHPIGISYDSGRTWFKEIADTTTPKEAAKRSQVSPRVTLKNLNDLKKIYISPNLYIYKQNQPRRYLITDDNKDVISGFELNEGKGYIYSFYLDEKGVYNSSAVVDIEKFTKLVKRIPESVKKEIEKDFDFKFNTLIEEKKKYVKKYGNDIKREITVTKTGNPKKFIDSMFGNNNVSNIVDDEFITTEKGENGGSIKKRYSFTNGVIDGSKKFTFREKEYRGKNNSNKGNLSFFPDKNSFTNLFGKADLTKEEKEKILKVFEKAKNYSGRIKIASTIINKTSANIDISVLSSGILNDKPYSFVITKEKCPELWEKIIGPVKKVKQSITMDDYDNVIRDHNWKTFKDPKLINVYKDLVNGKAKIDDRIQKISDNNAKKNYANIAKDGRKMYYMDNSVEQFSYQDPKRENYDPTRTTGYQELASKVLGTKIIGLSNYISLDDNGELRAHFKTADKKVKTVNFNVLDKDFSDPKLEKEKILVFILGKFGTSSFEQKLKYMVGLQNYKKICDIDVPDDKIDDNES